jgi:DNA-binding transcriptional LysR family regulator
VAKHPDLNLLSIAFALYDELSVSRAAKVLGMSQPAVSKALRRLRDSFDDPLFVRGPTGIVPTPRAHVLVRAARPHIERVRAELLKGESFDPATSTRPIALAMSDIGEMAFFPSILAHLRSQAPSCPVSTVRRTDDELPQTLETGDVDVAVGFFPNLALRNVRQRRLAKHGFACLMRAGHPRWKERLPLDDFLAVEHVVVRPQGRSSEEVLERFIERRRLRRKIATYTSHVLSVPFIVKDSDLVATVPYAVVTRFTALTRDLVAALPPFEITYELKMHWHRRFDNDARSGWLREQLTEAFRRRQWLAAPGDAALTLEREV